MWDVFLTQIESQAAFTPWMFATGNHDMEPVYGKTSFLGGSATHGYGGHVARLDLPGNGPRICPSVYQFVYGNVAVISVDANDLSTEIQTNTGYSDGAQLRWLSDTLKHWRTDPDVAPTIDFVVASFHHCAYSTTNSHASDGGLRRRPRSAVQPQSGRSGRAGPQPHPRRSCSPRGSATAATDRRAGRTPRRTTPRTW